jgi:hypothetical protein
MNKRKVWSVWLPIVGAVVLLVGLLTAAGLTNTMTPQWISDRIVVASFEPSAEITALADGSSMNDTGRFYFFTGQPELNDSAQFNANCADVLNEQSIVMGCYTGRIFIFNVTDERIAGVRYVTSAHEMLHAAYDRLGILEKNRVDGLISQQLENTTDQNILNLVKVYDELEPGHRLNELHSIFGTEVRDLNDELSEYYNRYFNDRIVVVSAAEQYEDVFRQMEKRANEQEARLVNLSQEIEVLSASYEADVKQLNSDIDRFNVHEFSSEAEFYAQRNTLVSRQAELGFRADSINTKINQYNQYIEELRAIGREIDKLHDHINSQSVGI